MIFEPPDYKETFWHTNIPTNDTHIVGYWSDFSIWIGSGKLGSSELALVYRSPSIEARALSEVSFTAHQTGKFLVQTAVKRTPP